MKKLLIIALILTASFGYSQKKDYKAKKDITPQEMAERKTEKMTSQLNLSDAQQARIHEIHLAKAERKMAAMEERKSMERGSKEKMGKMKEKNQEYKTAMKAILTEDQFARWEELKNEARTKRKAKFKKNKE